MPLHPVIHKALTLAAGSVPYHTLPIALARAQARQAYPMVNPPFPVGAVHDLQIPGPGGTMGLRIYRPIGEGTHPVVVFFHGSGFVVLDLDSHDNICRRLCAGASCVVVSVDYRLAPEHKFPAATDDCLAATRWAAKHAGAYGGDEARMAVAGDSAGGCLAAVTALRIRDEGGPALRGQLMWYPVTDYPSKPPGSYGAYGSGFGLTHEGMLWFWDQYLPESSAASHPHASPFRMQTMVGLPSAYVIVAEFDVLRDEGEAFAHRLNACGVEVVTGCQAGMNHGFLKYAGMIEEADAAIDDACVWLRRVLQIETSRTDT